MWLHLQPGMGKACISMQLPAYNVTCTPGGVHADHWLAVPHAEVPNRQMQRQCSGRTSPSRPHLDPALLLQSCVRCPRTRLPRPGAVQLARSGSGILSKMQPGPPARWTLLIHPRVLHSTHASTTRQRCRLRHAGRTRNIGPSHIFLEQVLVHAGAITGRSAHLSGSVAASTACILLRGAQRCPWIRPVETHAWCLPQVLG